SPQRLESERFGEVGKAKLVPVDVAIGPPFALTLEDHSHAHMHGRLLFTFARRYTRAVPRRVPCRPFQRPIHGWEGSDKRSGSPPPLAPTPTASRPILPVWRARENRAGRRGSGGGSSCSRPSFRRAISPSPICRQRSEGWPRQSRATAARCWPRTASRSAGMCCSCVLCRSTGWRPHPFHATSRTRTGGA